MRSAWQSTLLRRALSGAVALAMTAGSAVAQGTAQPPGPVDPLTQKLEVMLKSLRIARDWHVGRPAKSELLAGAIEGMLAKLDPEAEIYSRSELRRSGKAEATATADVGLELRRDPAPRRRVSAGYRVVSSRDESPAAMAGLRSGDLVTQVGGRPAADLSHLALVNVELPGGPGSTLTLTVERDGEARDVSLTRTDKVPDAVVVSEPEPGVLHARMSVIDKRSPAAFEGELSAALARLGSAVRGIVIDLRATAGGSFSEVPALADALLEQGVTLVEEARKSEGGEVWQATAGDILGGRPVIVLVDEGTAGPAEALAAALKDNGRARTVGVKTAGRGAVRSLRPLGRRGEKGAVRIITQRLHTPAGRPIEGRGLTPDVAVVQSPAEPACRGVDVMDATAAVCRRRSLTEDAQLRRAIVLLADTVATGGTSTAGAPPGNPDGRRRP